MYKIFNIFKKKNRFLPSEDLFTELTYPQYYKLQSTEITKPNRRDFSTISDFLLKNSEKLDCQITARRIMVGPMWESNITDRTFFEIKTFSNQYAIKVFYKCNINEVSPMIWYYRTDCVEGILQLSLLYKDFNKYANGKVY